MPLSLAAAQKDLLSIFKIEAQYVIPTYQRPYSWEYDECLQLYGDITEAFQNNEDYFIGNIVIAKSDTNKDRLEVIDGQQRLTTLLLFIKILSLFVPDHKALLGCLEKEDWEGGKTEPRIKSEIFEASDGDQFTEVLSLKKENFDESMISLKDQKGNFNTKKFPNRFERNALFFYSWVEFYSRENDLKEFIKFLLQRVYLLPIELTGKTFDEAGEKALTIFETLNNRGKSLDDADIFKAKLYNKAKKINEERIFIESWAELKNRCDVLSIKIDDVFRYYSHIIRGREGKTSLEINIRNFFIKMEYSPFILKKYNEILDDLFAIVNVIEYINEEKSKSTELAKWLQLIEIYTNQYPKIAIVVYLFVYKDGSDTDLISYLKKLVRFSYYAGSTSTIKFAIFNIIRDVSMGKVIAEFIREDIADDYFDYLGLLKYGYALLAFYLSQNIALKSFVIDKLINYKDERYLKEGWNKAKIEAVANSLGNFVILDIPKINTTINNKASHYNTSNIAEIKGLSKRLDDFTYDDFIARDKQLKEILMAFFKGKL